MKTPMHQLSLTWTWVLESPLHVGSGMAEAGRADRLIARGPDGKPYIPADAVKGALRMAAEQVVGWLTGAQPEYIEGEPNEPRQLPLALCFGGSGTIHYKRGSLENDVEPRCLSSTALDPSTGSALDNTLRIIEVVPPGACFRTGAIVWAAESELDTLKSLLLAALGACERVGGKAGIGWGRVRPENVRCIVIREEEIGPSIDAPALELLAVALGKSVGTLTVGPPRTRPGGGAVSTAGAKPIWRRLDLILDEPACLADKPLVGNEVRSRSHIPGTAIRGALRARWEREGWTEADILRWLGTATRFSPGFPAASDGSSLVPVPRSYLREKDSSPLATTWIDVLVDVDEARLAERRKGQWRSVGGGFMTATAPHRQESPVERLATMHVALDYRRGSKRGGALYSRQSISGPGGCAVRFVAWAQVPQDAPLDGEVFVGQRTSAGRGHLTVKSLVEDPPWSGGDESEAREIYLALLSPAIVRCPEGGHLRRTIRPEDWLHQAFAAANEKGKIPGAKTFFDDGCQASSTTVTIPGWIRTWGHGRAAAIAVEAGSVFRLRCVKGSDAKKLRGWLKMLEVRGLGERTHEGFGWFAVDPPWLGYPDMDVAVGTPGETTRASARPWPGCDLGAKALRDWIGEVHRSTQKAKTTEGVIGSLRVLARTATLTGATARTVMDHCRRMAGRSEPRAWTPLREGEPLRQLLERAEKGGLEALRFVLEALIIRLSPEAHESRTPDMEGET